MNTADVVLIVLASSAISFLLVTSSGRRDLKDLQLRLRRLESKVDGLLSHAGITVEPAGLHGVYEQLGQGKKIAAIKTYRDVTGAGLADAKAAVERMERGEQL